MKVSIVFSILVNGYYNYSFIPVLQNTSKYDAFSIAKGFFLP